MINRTVQVSLPLCWGEKHTVAVWLFTRHTGATDIIGSSQLAWHSFGSVTVASTGTVTLSVAQSESRGGQQQAQLLVHIAELQETKLLC